MNSSLKYLSQCCSSQKYHDQEVVIYKPTDRALEARCRPTSATPQNAKRLATGCKHSEVGNVFLLPARPASHEILQVSAANFRIGLGSYVAEPPPSVNIIMGRCAAKEWVI